MEFTQEFKHEIKKENSFKTIKDNVSNKHILLTESSIENDIFIKVYEIIYDKPKSFSQFKKLKINYTPFNFIELLKKSCITFKNRYLCLFLESELFIFNINTASQIASKSFIDQEIDINYFISPTNHMASELINIEPIEKTDDLIALNNLNELIYLSLNQNNRLKLVKNYKYKMNSFKVNMNLLLGFDNSSKKLICYNLDDLSSKNNFGEPKFTIDLISNVLFYGFSLNQKYFYTIENKLLKLYKTDDHKKIGETTLYTNVNNSLCTNDFVCLTMRDNRFISFLIAAEPNDYDKIRNLESRTGILTDDDKKICENVLQNAEKLQESSDEDDDDENLIKFLFEKDNKENKANEKFKNLSNLYFIIFCQNKVAINYFYLETKKKKYIKMSMAIIKVDECKEKNWHINLLKNKFNYRNEDLFENQKMEKQVNMNENLDYFNENMDMQLYQNLGRKSRIDFNQKFKDDLLNSLTSSDHLKTSFKSLNTGQTVAVTNNHSKLCLIQ
jgi:hypothetical protein